MREAPTLLTTIIFSGETTGLAPPPRWTENDSSSITVVEAVTFQQTTSPMASFTLAGDLVFVSSLFMDANLGADWGFMATLREDTNVRELHHASRKCLG